MQYHAEVIGSLLRPDYLKVARKQWEAGKLTTGAFKRIEDRAVDEMIALHGCDNTLQHAETWARAHKVAWFKLNRSLRSLGGFCDCEIGLNTVADGEEEPEDW